MNINDDKMTRIIKHLLDKGIIREEYKGCYYPNNRDYKLMVNDTRGGHGGINHIIDDGGVYYGMCIDCDNKMGAIPLSVVNMKVKQTVDIDLTVI